MLILGKIMFKTEIYIQVSEVSNTRILCPSDKVMEKWTLNWPAEEKMNKYSVNFSKSLLLS